jgi:hypothetical protein
MKCSSCDKQKSELFPRDSVLLSGIQLYLCRSCIDSKFEPRWTIILASHQNGTDYVKPYISKNLYVGRKILAEELLS